jgi:protein arginine N-methyltransferase 5
VSELLGGFGDNELSPELIYSVYEQDMVKPGGVSIPCSYTSYVAPIYCPLAYHRVM